MNTENDVRLLEGAYALCKANFEQLQADTAHYKRVFDALLDHGFAKSENATPAQWADELCAAIEEFDARVIAHQQADAVFRTERERLREELAALQDDKKRLDWLEGNALPWSIFGSGDRRGEFALTWRDNTPLRAAMDAEGALLPA